MIVTDRSELADLLEQLEMKGFGAHRRVVRLGWAHVRGPFSVQIPGGQIVVRRPTGKREGPPDSLVADVVVAGVRTIVRGGASKVVGNRDRRSIRIDDETWKWLESQGEPSAVVKDAIALLRSQRTE